jgi:hypothetical protein
MTAREVFGLTVRSMGMVAILFGSVDALSRVPTRHPDKTWRYGVTRGSRSRRVSHSGSCDDLVGKPYCGLALWSRSDFDLTWTLLSPW